MALPKQVEEAGKRAEDLHKKVYGKTEDPGQDPPAPENPGEGDPPAPENPPEPPQEETVDSLKHKLSVLQGKYNKEVKELRDKLGGVDLAKLQSDLTVLGQQVVDLSKKNGELTVQNEELSKKLENASAAPAPTASAQTSLESLSDEERKHLQDAELDDDTMAIIAKVAGGQGGDSAKLLEEINSLKSEVTSVKETSQQERVSNFWKVLKGQVENFEEINNDEKFINWLGTTVSPKFPGMTRQQAMNDAGDRLDADQAASLFKEYIKETNPPAPPAEDPNKKKLENEIEPSTSATGDPTQIVKPGRKYTPEDIKKFYKDQATSAASNYTTGPWAGKKAECEAMDKDIQKAANDGRVIQGSHP